VAKCCGPVGSLGAEHRHKEDRGRRHPQANGFHREDLRDTTPWPVNLWHALRCSRMHEIRALALGEAGLSAATGARYVTPRSSDMSTAGVPVFLTAQQVADMLQVDERTVLRWAQQDASMPATRLGRVVRFEREALLRWLALKRPRAARSVSQLPTHNTPGPA
jgi:excisionase family DNA binding protein